VNNFKIGLDLRPFLLYNIIVNKEEEQIMKQFKVIESVVMKREIIVEAESAEEVKANYENGDYDEELEGYFFDGQYDDRKIKVKECK